ncbi:hypothetical protein GCM10009558_098150 [Virgisporangium aurantiacum]
MIRRRPTVGLAIVELAAAAALVGGPGRATPAQATPPIGAWQNILAYRTGKCVDVYAQWTGDGALVHQWNCRMYESQHWTFVPTGDGYYYVIARHSGKCLDVQNASTAERATVHQWTCVGWPNQQWRLEPVTHLPYPGYLLVARHSGMCLDLFDASPADGTRIQQMRCSGFNGQWWSLGPPQ